MKEKKYLIVVLILMVFSSAIYAQDSTTRLEELNKELEELNTLIDPKDKRIKEIYLEWKKSGKPYSELSGNTERKRLMEEIKPLSDSVKIIEYEIYTIDLADILKSERIRGIYNQILAADSGGDARTIVQDYRDSLINEAIEAGQMTQDLLLSINRIARILNKAIYRETDEPSNTDYKALKQRLESR